jgi:hypothetical protein
MNLKVQLVKDGKVIVEVPLEREGWEEEVLESELTEFESYLNDPLSDKMSYLIDTLASCLVEVGGDKNLEQAKELYDRLFKIDKIKILGIGNFIL